jgi:hypothetical protein
MRHALPWSLINQYHIRESSVLDANSVAKKQLAPKSADNGKREIDDRRLRELLEELYKDKKYFDHMITDDSLMWYWLMSDHGNACRMSCFGQLPGTGRTVVCPGLLTVNKG